MASKMRNNKNEDSFCCNCGETQKQVLNMYDLCIGDTIFTICDRCVEQMQMKLLKAIVERNGRVKSGRDMAIIRRRGQDDYETRRWERFAAGTQTVSKEELPSKTKKGKSDK